jgi:predicted DNA-binding transcriptional regulator AlpA
VSGELERLFSGGDVARRLGLSLQRVHQLRNENSGFPQPIGKLGNYYVWRAADIERWRKKNGR